MTPDPVIPVAVHGMTWTAGLVALLNLLVGGALVQWIRGRPAMRQLEKEASERLQDNLIKRVEQLEGRIDGDRERHSAEVAAMHAECDAEIRIMRHRVNNLNQCFEALVMMVRKIPQAADAVLAVTQMRERQMLAEAEEKSRVEAAKLESASARVRAAGPRDAP